MTNESSVSSKPGHQASSPDRRSIKIRVKLQALRDNMATARSLSGDSRQFATIKADAYGHGAVAVAHALSHDGASESASKDSPGLQASADGFAVVTLEEALELRQSGIQQPVLVLQGPQDANAASRMQHHDLWPVIHDHFQYGWFREHPDRGELRAWMKVDSGMGRLGFQPEEASRILSAKDGIRWTGLMTHFACADETANSYTDYQIQRFSSVDTQLSLQRSMANSAAVLAWPAAKADWARPGILLYGCNPLDRSLPDDVVLKPVMSVEAPLVSVKQMPRGTGIGYAQSWNCPEDMPIGYVGAGYRDGVPRVLDESACVSIAGRKCPIVGRVSMDSFAVDLRHVPEAQVGDTVELWGENNSVDGLAKAAGTISYELLTSIRGARIYID